MKENRQNIESRKERHPGAWEWQGEKWQNPKAQISTFFQKMLVNPFITHRMRVGSHIIKAVGLTMSIPYDIL